MVMNRAVEWVKDAVRTRSITHSLRSPHWPAVRDQWLKDHPWCAACGKLEEVQVHHKQPFHLHPELELDPSNFISLCESKPNGNHHLEIGHLGNWKGVNPNVEADALAKLKG
jgi:5-methylcytosine-specific restriction endonuclease McrA